MKVHRLTLVAILLTLLILVAAVIATSADLSNCPPKIWPVDINRIPHGADPAAWQDWVDHLNDDIVDPIYLRFCTYIDSVQKICNLDADTIVRCLEDTLTADFHAIRVRDLTNDTKSGALLMADTADQYAGFTVNRNEDSSYLDGNYVLVMPNDAGNYQEDRTAPGGVLAKTAWATAANSELLTDGKGNLYWMDRDYFPRIMVDTIIADTGISPSGIIVIEAERVELKSDTARAIDGKWDGSQNSIRFYEGIGGGMAQYVEVRAHAVIPPTEGANWTFVYPDSGNPYEGGYWRFTDGSTPAVGWAPYDDEFIIRGVDTAIGTATRDTVNWHVTQLRPPSRSNSVRYDDFDDQYSYQVYTGWARFNADSAMGYDGSTVYGCPDFTDVRYGQIGVVNGIALAQLDNYNGGMAGGVHNLSDTTFIVNLPAYGSDDSLKVYYWTLIGRLNAYQGTGQ